MYMRGFCQVVTMREIKWDAYKIVAENRPCSE